MDVHPEAHLDVSPRRGWLHPGELEWERAWSAFPDPVLEHPQSGEVLQYMGSTHKPGRGWVHVFRHRHMPGSQQRQYAKIPASAGWAPQRQPQASDDDRREETTQQ